jgi:hypothetical protein
MIALEAHSPTAAAEKSLLLRLWNSWIFSQATENSAKPGRYADLSDQPRKLLSNQTRVSRSFDRKSARKQVAWWSSAVILTGMLGSKRASIKSSRECVRRCAITHSPIRLNHDSRV